MRKSKTCLIVLAILLLTAVLAGCGSNGNETTADPDTGNTEPAESTDAEETMTESLSETDDASATPDGIETEDVPGGTEEAQDNTIKLQIGETVWTATLVENSSTEALKELLAEGPVTIDMRDYGNMEKVGGIGTSLPTNDEQIITEPGDLILFQANALVIYYEPNSWNFTRLGKISDDVTQEELKDVLGSGNVSVTLSLDQE